MLNGQSLDVVDSFLPWTSLHLFHIHRENETICSVFWQGADLDDTCFTETQQHPKENQESIQNL